MHFRSVYFIINNLEWRPTTAVPSSGVLMSIGILHFFIKIVNSDSLLAILDSKSDGYESSHCSSVFMFAKVFMANGNANASGTDHEVVKGTIDDNTPADLNDHVAREATTQRVSNFYPF